MADYAEYDNDGNFSLPVHIFHNIPTKLYSYVNLLKTKRNLLYIRNQSVPRSKHFPPRL